MDADDKSTSSRVAKLKAAKKAKEREKKEQEAVAKKNMANLRVVQKNLVYVLGLNPRLASEEVGIPCARAGTRFPAASINSLTRLLLHEKILRQHDFLGQFGPIKKIVISRRGGGSVIGPSSSNQNLGVYVTFNRKEDATKAIEAIEGSTYEGRTIRLVARRLAGRQSQLTSTCAAGQQMARQSIASSS